MRSISEDSSGMVYRLLCGRSFDAVYTCEGTRLASVRLHSVLMNTGTYVQCTKFRLPCRRTFGTLARTMNRHKSLPCKGLCHFLGCLGGTTFVINRHKCMRRNGLGVQAFRFVYGCPLAGAEYLIHSAEPLNVYEPIRTHLNKPEHI